MKRTRSLVNMFLVLSLVLLMVSCQEAASGPEPDAQIGSVSYLKLSDALSAVKSGETIKLLDNVRIARIETSSTDNFTLDLNGKTLRLTGGFIQEPWDNPDTESFGLFTNNGTLKITDSTGSKKGTVLSNSAVTCLLLNNKSLTLEGVNVELNTYFNHGADGNASVAAIQNNEDGAILTINNCTVSCSSARNGNAIAVFNDKAGSAENADLTYTATIENSTLKAYAKECKAYTLYCTDCSKVTATGCTITAESKSATAGKATTVGAYIERTSVGAFLTLENCNVTAKNISAPEGTKVIAVRAEHEGKASVTIGDGGTSSLTAIGSATADIHAVFGSVDVGPGVTQTPNHS